jgi:hypothetical protein
MVDRLALACERQAATGDAFTLTKARGLYERRTLLPTPLASLSRARLRKLADLAMCSGKLAKASDGGLVPPGAVSNRTV